MSWALDSSSGTNFSLLIWSTSEKLSSSRRMGISCLLVRAIRMSLDNLKRMAVIRLIPLERYLEMFLSSKMSSKSSLWGPYRQDLLAISLCVFSLSFWNKASL